MMWVGITLLLLGTIVLAATLAYVLLHRADGAARASGTAGARDRGAGALVRIEGRVVVPEPVYAPSGRPCALVEIYATDGRQAAQPRERRIAPFFIDDGTRGVRINPAVDVVAFDLPTVDLGDADEALVERHLEPGARVLVVGRLAPSGELGLEELVPAEGASSVGLTYLSPPAAPRSRSPLDEMSA